MLAIIFACVTFLIALRTLSHYEPGQLAAEVPSTPVVGVIPVLIGAISTVMGIGGGVMSVIALRIFGQPVRRAVGTAALLGLAIAVPGTLGMVVAGWDDPRLPAWTAGFVSLPGVLAIAPLTVLAAPLGARLAHRIPEKMTQRLFGAFLLLTDAEGYLLGIWAGNMLLVAWKHRADLILVPQVRPWLKRNGGYR